MNSRQAILFWHQLEAVASDVFLRCYQLFMASNSLFREHCWNTDVSYSAFLGPPIT